MTYVQMCEEEILKCTSPKVKIEDKKIFEDMYEQLKGKTNEYINERSELLAETLYMALQIGRKFFSVFMFYVVANIVILALQLDYIVTCISVMLMGICFLYKLTEFLSNKYCFIDAYLIINLQQRGKHHFHQKQLEIKSCKIKKRCTSILDGNAFFEVRTLQYTVDKEK